MIDMLEHNVWEDQLKGCHDDVEGRASGLAFRPRHENKVPTHNACQNIPRHNRQTQHNKAFGLCIEVAALGPANTKIQSETRART